MIVDKDAPQEGIRPYEQEQAAMAASAGAFDDLNEEQRLRVWRWLAMRYRLEFRGGF